ncbi:MAG TPA: lipopolysaccharide heptosyltransferase II [Syntrophales bacterium]|nr:lipopolysaccharide heptosyltransferase II [Syntrophales bacterium]
MMQLRNAKKLPRCGVERVLIRGTNWIGDAVITLAAISAVRETYPQAGIFVLAKPWVADIYRLCPYVDEVIVYESPGVHHGILGLLRLAKELKDMNFGVAILLQNAIEAAIIARLAGIPVRAGYNTDARGFLLTHAVVRTKAVKKIHQTGYYVKMLKALGCEEGQKGPYLSLADEDRQKAGCLLQDYGMDEDRPIIGMAPGATYGPAKKWFPERFAVLADRLKEEFSAQIILFGSEGDRGTTAAVQRKAVHPLIDLAGVTHLRTAISLIARCRLFISNDSGLMHVAGGLNIPTIAIFGSTNPLTTSPIGDKNTIIYRGVDCSPCLKETCSTDFRCMDIISTDEVYRAAKRVLCGM